jgi:hypothetical protein
MPINMPGPPFLSIVGWICQGGKLFRHIAPALLHSIAAFFSTNPNREMLPLTLALSPRRGGCRLTQNTCRGLMREFFAPHYFASSFTSQSAKVLPSVSLQITK